MADFKIPMPGWSITLLSLHEGFSFTMGLLLMAVGVLNLLVAGFLSVENISAKIRRIALFNCIQSLMLLVMSAIFFFIVPVIFSLVATISYGIFYRCVCVEYRKTRG